MKKHLIKLRSINGRLVAGLSATVLMLALTAGVLPTPLASAAQSQVSTRSIQLSSSTISATAVTYNITFTPIQTGAQSFVVDFCSNTAIIGGACTAPAGFTAAGFTPATVAAGAAANYTTSSPSANTLKFTKNTGSALTTAVVNVPVGGIVNPSAVGTFYARVYTYCDATFGSTCPGPPANTAWSAPATPGSYLDYGGFALSTNNVINVTATVMESLTFCVSKVAPGAACSGLSTPNLILGHGSPQILDASAVDTDTAFTQVSTNALNGVIVQLKTGNSCTGLSRDGGATCPIPGKGAFGAVAAGTAFFGLNVADGAGGTGTVSHNANYGTTVNQYGMGATTTSTYGDPIESSPGATANVNSSLTYAATASVTTPAGVYSANQVLIATGTF